MWMWFSLLWPWCIFHVQVLLISKDRTKGRHKLQGHVARWRWLLIQKQWPLSQERCEESRAQQRCHWADRVTYALVLLPVAIPNARSELPVAMIHGLSLPNHTLSPPEIDPAAASTRSTNNSAEFDLTAPLDVRTMHFDPSLQVVPYTDDIATGQECIYLL